MIPHRLHVRLVAWRKDGGRGATAATQHIMLAQSCDTVWDLLAQARASPFCPFCPSSRLDAIDLGSPVTGTSVHELPLGCLICEQTLGDLPLITLRVCPANVRELFNLPNVARDRRGFFADAKRLANAQTWRTRKE
jgi:hypothetical protein